MINLPNYNLLELVKQYKNEAIFRGVNKLSHPVIIKVLSLENLLPGEIAYFTNEYDVSKSINSDGLLKMYELFKRDNCLILIKEDFQGESLKSLINKGEVSQGEFLRIIFKITQTINDIHKSNIIHTNLNPDNIIYNRVNGKLKVLGLDKAMRHVPGGNNEEHMETPYNLMYSSPEQTSRLKINIDFRSDLYALGVIFYEILTGVIPFKSQDSGKHTYYQFTHNPIEPFKIKPGIPLVLSALIMKLLAKNVEERYQTAAALLKDIQECLINFEHQGHIPDFPLGRYDTVAGLYIPDKLYGREEEIGELINSIYQIKNGKKIIHMIYGSSGIGKTSIISSIDKLKDLQPFFFISGKGEQLSTNVPYFPLTQALRQLVRKILTWDKEVIEEWRNKILRAVGENGHFIIELIPELTLIIGPQSVPNVLSGLEGKNRFQHLFSNFIKVFATKSQPLILYLDDLQWTDSATFGLIELLLEDRELKYFLFIGSYRDNEIYPNHSLDNFLNGIKSKEIIFKSTELKPMKMEAVKQFLGEILNNGDKDISAISELIYVKSHGNPFYIRQLLKVLYEEKLLSYHEGQGYWQWDINKIKELDLTENVIQLLSARIKKMTPEAQNLLQMAACVGNKFNLFTLAYLTGKTIDGLAMELNEAEELGLIKQIKLDVANVKLSQEENIFYTFCHDRVINAIYKMISGTAAEQWHLMIGSYLLVSYLPEDDDHSLFDIVNHLNHGRRLIDNQEERYKLARLNLAAGMKAKVSTAYGPALNFITIGLELLTYNSWDTHYELTFNLSLEQAQCEFLNINYSKAEELFNSLHIRAKDQFDKVKISKLHMELYTNIGRGQDTINLGIDTLKLLNVHLDAKPNKLHMLKELIKVERSFGKVKVGDLASLPIMQDKETLAVCDILMALTPVAYLMSQEFFVLVVLKIVSLSRTYGNTGVSAFGYGLFGLLLAAGFGKYEKGYQFGQLGLLLNEELDDKKLSSKCNFNFGWFINHWRASARGNLKYLAKGIKDGLETGDIVFAAYCSSSYIVNLYSVEENLDLLNEASQKQYNLVTTIKNEYTAQPIIIIQRYIMLLKGLTPSIQSFSDQNFDEDKFVSEITETSIKALYLIIKMEINYLFGQYQLTNTVAQKAVQYLPGALGTLYSTDYYFYSTLAKTALYFKTSFIKRKKYFISILINIRKFKKWSNNSPDNFKAKYFLLKGELARILGNNHKAINYYNLAIKFAVENDYIKLAAIGYELLTKVYLQQEDLEQAEINLINAKNIYRKWGATRKELELEKNM